MSERESNREERGGDAGKVVNASQTPQEKKKKNNRDLYDRSRERKETKKKIERGHANFVPIPRMQYSVFPRKSNADV